MNFVVSDNCDDSTLPSISTDKKVYAVGEPVVVNYDNAPCIDRDWIGIYERSVVPVNSKCPTYAYVGGSPQGSLTLNVAGTINFTSALKDGIYFAGYFNADGYYESCARAPFVIGKPVILEAGVRNIPPTTMLKCSTKVCRVSATSRWLFSELQVCAPVFP